MTKTYILTLLCALCWAMEGAGQSNINLNEPPAIAKMMEQYAASNKARTVVSGWRVQVLATTDRQRLEQTRQQFQSRYPNVLIDWIHSKPYYKLRAGAYSTKLEATRLRHILDRDYSGLYLVKDDNIKPHEFLN